MADERTRHTTDATNSEPQQDPHHLLPATGTADAASPREFHAAPAKRKPITDPGHMLPEHASADEKGNHKKLFIFIACVLGLFLLLFFFGWLPEHHRNQQIKKEANEEKTAEPVLDVIQVQPASAAGGLVIPGTTTALTEAYVYARANGYLKRRYVDIGDHVVEGQLLALIDAPDLDQQVDQAREQVKQAEAQLAQQRANLALALVTVERYRVLVAKGVFSRQQGDQQEANYGEQEANVAAAARNVEAFRANLRRTIALQSYERVTSPFTGIVTARNVDVGALISASGSASPMSSAPSPSGQASTSGGSQQPGQSNNGGSSGSVSQAATPSGQPGQGGPLFAVAQVNRLRILMAVPEGYADSIRAGVHAKLNFQEFPDNTFYGDVTRTSGSIDENTRTLLTEVQVDNREGKLLPGMYAVTTFPPGVGTPPLTVPGDSVVIRHDMSVIAVVADGKVRLVPVTLGRDYGPSVEVLSGLHRGDLIVTNVTDDVVDGKAVKTKLNQQATEAEEQKPDQTAPPGGNTQYGNEGITDTAMQNKQSQANGHGKGQQSTQSHSASRP